MSEELDPIITVFSRGRKYLLGKSANRAGSYFGGPGYDLAFEAPRHGPRELHHVVTLKHGPFGIHGVGMQTSFYYGICYEGCEIEWTRTATAAVKVTKLIPRKSSKNWPYMGYPEILPWFPLKVMHEEDASLEEIADAIYNTSWEASLDKVYVIVHSHPQLGIALFSPSMSVDLVFEYDTDSGRIRGTNICD